MIYFCVTNHPKLSDLKLELFEDCSLFRELTGLSGWFSWKVFHVATIRLGLGSSGGSSGALDTLSLCMKSHVAPSAVKTDVLPDNGSGLPREESQT